MNNIYLDSIKQLSLIEKSFDDDLELLGSGVPKFEKSDKSGEFVKKVEEFLSSSGMYEIYDLVENFLISVDVFGRFNNQDATGKFTIELSQKGDSRILGIKFEFGIWRTVLFFGLLGKDKIELNNCNFESNMSINFFEKLVFEELELVLVNRIRKKKIERIYKRIY